MYMKISHVYPPELKNLMMSQTVLRIAKIPKFANYMNFCMTLYKTSHHFF